LDGHFPSIARPVSGCAFWTFRVEFTTDSKTADRQATTIAA
jgi:hypothetical protein